MYVLKSWHVLLINENCSHKKIYISANVKKLIEENLLIDPSKSFKLCQKHVSVLSETKEKIRYICDSLYIWNKNGKQ